ncbi:UNVERIFIED_CONTAM: hypothetical protein Slati_3931100, partial [Sesamum latifolium]
MECDDLQQRVQYLENKLARLLSGRLSPAVSDNIAEIRKELENGVAHDETVWKQRSKILWLREGDRNIGFFHRRASTRFQTNLIRKVKNSDGVWVITEEGIKKCISDHFGTVFASNRPQPNAIAKGMEHLRAVVDASMAEELLQPYTTTEVKKALFQMAPLKSSGPDGMSPIFFQKFWHIVGQDVTTCVLSLLNSHIMPSSLNFTQIVLIPKCKNPESLTQFRPISLCNVVYKIASKAIANRLKVFLDRIISPAQSAFVHGRLISDNVLLALELNHFLNTKTRGEQGWMALKLDVSKAYDKVEWSFLEQFGSLVPERGLRQGDLSRPTSSYCAQSPLVLYYSMRNRTVEFGVLVSRGAPSISHLLFADDTLIFSQASLENAQAIREVLETYRGASGQEINFSKSSMTFSRNTREEVCQYLAANLTIRRENKMELYLGLPSRMARSKRDLFATIRDRIWQKVTGWNDKLLSQACKEILIKAVIQAVPSYAMGCFKLPLTLLKEIQGTISRFWWGNRGKNKTHWVSWNRLCESKLSGGLGFRHLHLFNLAMLAKQWWRILRHPECLLSRVLRARYFPSGDIFLAILGSRPSYTWRSVMAAYDLFQAGCRWHVGSGSHIRIWEDSWLPRPWSFRPITPAPVSHSEIRVSELIDPTCNDWDSRKIELFWPVDSDLILRIPLSRLGTSDLLIWHYSRSGIFSARSAYHLACSLEHRPCSSSLQALDQLWWMRVWQAKIPNKHLGTLTGVGVPISSRWTAPPPGCIKVNFDGTTFRKGLGLGSGVVARNENGACVAWLARCFNKTDFSVIGPIIEDIHAVAASFHYVSFQYVKRSCNVVAHHLAQSARNPAEGGQDIPPAAAS